MNLNNLGAGKASIAILILAALLSVSCSQTAKRPETASGTVPKNTPPAGESLKPETSQIAIEKYAFGPTQLTISAGTKVTWTNKDPIQHSVTSDQNTFDSGLLGQNQEFSKMFDEPGVYPYHCRPHPNMKAQIIVK